MQDVKEDRSSKGVKKRNTGVSELKWNEASLYYAKDDKKKGSLWCA